MKKGKVKTIISIFCVFTLILIAFSPYSQANSMSGDQLMNKADSFISNGQKQGNKLDLTQMKNTLMPIGKILVTIATIVLTAVTAIMAIKYMMCDTADKKAKLKTQLIGLVVSTVVIYGAQLIWSLLFSLMNGITSGS